MRVEFQCTVEQFLCLTVEPSERGRGCRQHASSSPETTLTVVLSLLDTGKFGKRAFALGRDRAGECRLPELRHHSQAEPYNILSFRMGAYKHHHCELSTMAALAS